MTPISLVFCFFCFFDEEIVGFLGFFLASSFGLIGIFALQSPPVLLLDVIDDLLLEVDGGLFQGLGAGEQ